MKATNIYTGETVWIVQYQDGKAWVSETEEEFNRGEGRCALFLYYSQKNNIAEFYNIFDEASDDLVR